MGNKIKLLWDFRGPDALKTAEHFLIHLNEFVERESVVAEKTDIEKHTDMFVSTILITESSYLEILKNALKPSRGQKVV